jgi:hypothetical protein
MIRLRNEIRITLQAAPEINASGQPFLHIWYVSSKSQEEASCDFSSTHRFMFFVITAVISCTTMFAIKLKAYKAWPFPRLNVILLAGSLV